MLIILGVQQLVWSQEWQGHSLNAIQLPDKTNAFIGTMSTGELIIGSLNGWGIYDGLKTSVYDITTNPELIDHTVQSHFFTASDGKVWFATYQALVAFDNEKKSTTSFQLRKDTMVLDSDYYMFHMQNDTIFGSIGKELFFYDIKSGKSTFTEIKFDNYWTKFFVIDGQIHLINYFKSDVTGHYIFDGDDFSRVTKKVIPFRTYDVCAYSSHQCVLATNDGLKLYNFFTGNIEEIFPELNDKHVRSIAKSGRKKFLCADDSGIIYFLDSISSRTMNGLLPSSLAIQHVWYLNGIFVISSYGSGIWLFEKDIGFFQKSTLNQKYYPSFIIDLEDSYILTSYFSGPLFRKHSQSSFRELENSKFSAVIGVSQLPANEFLITEMESRKVLKMNEKGMIEDIIIPNAATLKTYKAQYHSSEDKTTLSTFDGKIYIGKIEENKFIIEDSILWDDRAKGVGYVISSANHLISSINNQYGILYDKCDQGYLYKKKIDLKGKVAMHAIDNHRKCIWLATQYGLLRFDNESESLVNIVLPFSHAGILSVLLDDFHRIWFSTVNGIYIYIPEQAHFQMFGTGNGYFFSDFTESSALKLKDGNFLFGGVFGWVIFKPNDFLSKGQDPKIRIRNILLNDVVKISAIEDKKLILNYKVNTFSIDFAAMTLTGALHNRVKYRLYPEDKFFLEAGSATGFARYSHLKPGNYQFQIIAANASGVWMKDSYVLDIIVYPPWWETWWFRLIAIISLVILIGYFSRLYYKRQIEKKDLLLREQKLIIEKQEAIQNERTRIAAEMHDDLGSGLTTIKYLSDKAMRNVTDPQEIVNIQQISEESNELVRNMSEIIWAMNARFDTLENLIIYIRRFAYEFLDQHQIAFELRIPDDIPDLKISGEKRRNIFLVVKEALHNVVKHSGSASATVSVLIDTELKIEIKDQGAGEGDNLDESAGNGLFNMKQRMKKIGGTCTFKNGSGWTVTLRLPLEALQN